MSPSKLPAASVVPSLRRAASAGAEPLESRTLFAAVIGGQLFSLGGPVSVEVLPATAGFTSELHLFSPGPDRFIATNRDTNTVVNLGSFPAGEELVFGIFVRDTNNTFTMGPGTRNPDGIAHAGVDFVGPGNAVVGFEDILGGGDLDYDDNVFRFTGAIAPNAPPSNLTLNSGTVDEDGTFVLTGSFTDPNADDEHTVTVDWGSGETPTTVTLPVGDRSFSIPHQYLDDNPTGTESDDYSVQVTVSQGGNYQASDYAFENLDLVPGAPGVGQFAALNSSDDLTAAVPLGSNTFNFYGTTYTGNSSLFISNNGLLTFDSGNGQFTNDDLTSGPPEAAIAPLWDDWVTFINAAGSDDLILFKFEDTTGSPAPDRLILEWNLVRHFPDSPSPVTFQAILELNTGGRRGDITFNYPDLNAGDPAYNNGASATVGIKNSNGSGGDPLLVSFNTTSPRVSSLRAIRVSAPPPASTSATTTVTVENLAPEITAVGSDAEECGSAAAGDTVTVTASLTDVGTQDTHTAVIDWGDGTTSAGDVTQDAGSASVSADHAYAAGGVYPIRVTVSDDDGGTDTAATSAVVTGVGVVDGVLYVVGTDGADQVHVNRAGESFNVHANFLDAPFQTVPAAGVRRIVLLLCDGDDHATIAGNIDTPAVIDGGAGNDLINGGRSSIVIGGAGADRLVGGPGDDTLVGGAVALADVLRIAAGTLPLTSGVVSADGAADSLTGSSGRDRFLANVTSAGPGDVLDTLADRKPDETVLDTP